MPSNSHALSSEVPIAIPNTNFRQVFVSPEADLRVESIAQHTFTTRSVPHPEHPDRMVQEPVALPNYFAVIDPLISVVKEEADGVNAYPIDSSDKRIYFARDETVAKPVADRVLKKIIDTNPAVAQKPFQEIFDQLTDAIYVVGEGNTGSIPTKPDDTSEIMILDEPAGPGEVMSPTDEEDRTIFVEFDPGLGRLSARLSEPNAESIEVANRVNTTVLLGRIIMDHVKRFPTGQLNCDGFGYSVVYDYPENLMFKDINTDETLVLQGLQIRAGARMFTIPKHTEEPSNSATSEAEEPIDSLSIVPNTIDNENEATPQPTDPVDGSHSTTTGRSHLDVDVVKQRPARRTS